MQDTDINQLTSLILAQARSGARMVVALAGPPGSGKSTATEHLCHALNARQADFAAILPMDGYHYDDGLLTTMGRLTFKGAPDTFDVGGFAHTLRRLKQADEDVVAVPVFDRSLEISRGSARLIARDVPVILAEGNYLLLEQQPWQELRKLFSITVKIVTPLDVIEQRLLARWRGFGLPEAEVMRKVSANDLPNARFVIDNSGAADFALPT